MQDKLMKKILSLRKKIDRTDDKIIDLLLKRFNLIKDLAFIKDKNSIPIYQKEREKKILLKLKNNRQILGIFKFIIKESKIYQKSLFAGFTKGKKSDKIV
jgi:chorismate mutase